MAKLHVSVFKHHKNPKYIHNPQFIIES